MVQVLGGSGGSGIPGAFWCGFWVILEVAVSFVFGMCRNGHVLGGSGSFLDVSLTPVGRWSVVPSWFKRFIVGGSGLGSSVGSGWFRVVLEVLAGALGWFRNHWNWVVRAGSGAG